MKTNKQTTRQFQNFEWIDIQHPAKGDLDEIAKQYELNYFQIVDSLEKGHLPKFEKESNYNFLILRALHTSIKKDATTIPEVSNKIAFFYSDKRIITIHRGAFAFLETADKEFKSVEKLLLYLIRKMLDTYHEPMENLDSHIEQLEQTVFLKERSKISLEQFYYLKTQTRITKKILLILQNVMAEIEIKSRNKTDLQDIRDRLLHLVLNYDEILENANHLLSAYLSINAQKGNEVMKLLTIFSAFFLPLTFIAGIYGMNFENMPELTWELGYLLVLGVMVCVAVLIFLWFKRKKIL